MSPKKTRLVFVGPFQLMTCCQTLIWPTQITGWAILALEDLFGVCAIRGRTKPTHQYLIVMLQVIHSKTGFPAASCTQPIAAIKKTFHCNSLMIAPGSIDWLGPAQ